MNRTIPGRLGFNHFEEVLALRCVGIVVVGVYLFILSLCLRLWNPTLSNILYIQVYHQLFLIIFYLSFKI